MLQARVTLLGFASIIFLSISACGGSKKATGDASTEDVISADPAEADVIDEDIGPVDATDATEAADPPHDVDSDAEDITSDAADAEEEGPCSTTAWHTYAATDTPITIPDNDETGVESSIAVDDCDIEVNDIRVDVNISHPFIGDLKVMLITPLGDEIYLHDRTGTITDDIVTTYPSLTTPAQTICVLMPVSSSIGDWKLNVSDNGAGDEGTFNSWSIMLNGTNGYCPVARYDSSDTFPIAIPDWDSTGIDSTIYISDHGAISGINILVDVEHSWIGDVRISLNSPSGASVVIYNNPSDTGDYLSSIFPQELSSYESMAVFLGAEKNGTWTLNAADLSPSLTGQLRKWILYIE
jgi:subtilisin-like proprotein convertase family protein